MDGNMKHIKKYRGFKNWLFEAKGYYIKVSIRDSKKALAILDEMYGKKFDISGSDTYYFKNEDMAHDAKYDLAARDIQVTDTNIEESAITERNAFLGARAKAIEEDLEEFEFNGKTYPVTIKNVDEGGPNYDDANFNLDKIFGDDQESIEIFQDIEDNGTVADMIDYIDEWGDEEMLQRYGIRSDAHVKKLAKKIMESKVTEDRFGHPITAQGNQAYVQMGKLLDMLSGKESKVVEKAYKKFWDILKPAMEAEEQKSEQNSKFKTAGQRAGFDMRGLK